MRTLTDKRGGVAVCISGGREEMEGGEVGRGSGEGVGGVDHC